MSINQVFSSGNMAIYQGMQGMAKNAQQIASAPVAQQQQQPDQITEALVNNLVDKNQAVAGTKVIQAASDTLGTILDISV